MAIAGLEGKALSAYPLWMKASIRWGDHRAGQGSGLLFRLWDWNPPGVDCDTTDPDLIRAVRSSDDAVAWERFERLYRPSILKHCQQAGLPGGQAEEVAQECFIKCSRYLPSFDHPPSLGQFRGWLNLMVNQQVAEFFRHSIRTKQIKQAYADLIRDFIPRTFDPTRDPNSFEYGLLSMAVQQARLRVRPLHWQLFEAQVIEGLPSTEVARQFGVRPVTVRVYAMRVKRVLRRCWKEVQDGPF